MPEETTPDLVTTLRRSIAAIGRRDFDEAFSAYGPDAVWDASTTGLGIFEGRQAIRRFFEDWWGSYEDYEQSIEELRDLGDGVTFGVVLQRARLSGSSGLVELRYAGVVVWSEGLIQRVTIYTDIDEGRAAAERLVEERG
jgi:ketosteroid isomerase-like protein